MTPTLPGEMTRSFMRARGGFCVAVLTGTVGMLAGCGSLPPRSASPAPRTPVTGPAATSVPAPAGTAPPAPPAAVLQAIPDATPQPEPRSRYGNPPFYDVFGKRYFVLSSAAGYVERGVASWYGPGFHEIRTSTGEPYDMYAMTAAHRTLPLPAYVRVTNLQNGRNVVVRVNDRGPFVGNRIIDLSYTAAAKLDMLRDGTAIVEVRALEMEPLLARQPAASQRPGSNPGVPLSGVEPPRGGTSAGMGANSGAASPPGTGTNAGAIASSGIAQDPGSPPGATSTSNADARPPPAARDPTTGRELFIQAGAFADPANAERMVAKLRSGNFGKIFLRDDKIAGRRMYRVRIGPVPDVATFDRIVAALDRAGIRDAHLALD